MNMSMATPQPVAAASRRNETADYPPEFDADFYRQQCGGLNGLSDEECLAHYQQNGREQGLWQNRWAGRFEFIKLIPEGRPTLEIGPGSRPILKGAHVRYFDVMDADALRRRALRFNEDVRDVPEAVHFVSDTGDLNIVSEKFATVVSSHSIEHQPDLVRHLQQVESLLEPGGAYYVLCPNIKYTHDIHMPETTIGDIIEAFVEKRVRHRLAHLVNNEIMQSHNDSEQHWNGETSVEPNHYNPDLILGQINAHQNTSHYIDVHAWYFTPEKFRICLNAIADCGLTKLRPVRVYETPRNANEFCAILKAI